MGPPTRNWLSKKRFGPSGSALGVRRLRHDGGVRPPSWGPCLCWHGDPVAHIPTTAIEAFSTRRRQIVEHLTLHGESGGRAAQIAAYATRSAKNPEAEPESLVDAWRAKASAHGLDDHVLAAALHKQELRNPPAPGSPAA